MTISKNQAVDVIAELWGERPSAREQRWLWVWLKYFFPGRPIFSIRRGASTVEPVAQARSLILDGDIDAELEQLLKQHATSIQTLKNGQFFNREEDFHWIGSDNHQLWWITDHLHKYLGIKIPDAEARLNRRDYFICLMDLALSSILDKRNYVSRLHQSWLEHGKKNSHLQWFSRDDEMARCEFAWQVLDTRIGNILGQEFKIYPGASGLKCYFDSLHVSEYEKKSHIDHIKKLWNQRKYREKQEKNKVRQRNFVLSDTTMKNLDKLANRLGTSRTEALERLIKLAAKHGMPSAQSAGEILLDDLPGNY